MRKLFSYHCRNFWKDYFDIRKYMSNIAFKIYAFKIDRLSRKHVNASILAIYSHGILWKSKYDTPRFEHCPCIEIILFSKFKIIFFYTYKRSNLLDDFFEQYLWIKYYCDNDIQKAVDTWQWYSDNKSTWMPELLKKKYRHLVRRTPIEEIDF